MKARWKAVCWGMALFLTITAIDLGLRALLGDEWSQWAWAALVFGFIAYLFGRLHED